MDLFISIDSSSNIPLYRQVLDSIKNAIKSGVLKAGEQIPSTRDLARSLGVSRVTTVKAYRELLAQGYLESGFGAGSRISRNMPSEKVAEYRQHITFAATPDREHSLDLSEFGRRLMQIEEPRYNQLDLPEMNYGAPPADLLPTKQWHQLLLKCLKEKDSTAQTEHCETFGYRPLREAIASFLRRTRAVNCDADQVVVFANSQQGLDMIARIMIAPNDRVVVENPGFICARTSFSLYGAQLVVAPIDENGMMVERLRDLEGPVKLIYVTPTHHDPTGVVMSPSRRVDLLRYANRLGAMVVEDDFDSMYKYGGKIHPSVQGIDSSDSVIYVSTFWKTLFPLVNFGFVVIPKRLIPVFERAKARVERISSVVESMALTEFIESGQLDSHIRRLRDTFSKRRQMLIFKLTMALKSNIKIHRDSGGTHVLVRFPEGLDSETLMSCATKAGLHMVSTQPFYVRNPHANEFLIPFAHLDEAHITEAVSRFIELLRAEIAGLSNDVYDPEFGTFAIDEDGDSDIDLSEGEVEDGDSDIDLNEGEVEDDAEAIVRCQPFLSEIH